MKGRVRMLPLKNNFKNGFKGNVFCPRCEKETDNEENLFGKCKILGDLYVKYNIASPGGLYQCNYLRRQKKLVYFIKESNLNKEQKCSRFGK